MDFKPEAKLLPLYSRYASAGRRMARLRNESGEAWKTDTTRNRLCHDTNNDLSDDETAVLTAKARAQGLSAEQYARQTAGR